MLEKDPRDIGYVALYIAIAWYTQITPEQSISLALGKSSAKPGVPCTPEKLQIIKRIMRSPNFKNFANIEKKMRINRYDIIEALREEGEFEAN